MFSKCNNAALAYLRIKKNYSPSERFISLDRPQPCWYLHCTKTILTTVYSKLLKSLALYNPLCLLGVGSLSCQHKSTHSVRSGTEEYTASSSLTPPPLKLQSK